MSEEELSGFRTDVGKVFRMVRYWEEKGKLAELMKNDAYYSDMPEDAYQVVAKYTHAVEIMLLTGYDRKAIDVIRRMSS